jgi:hypothetical protein
MSEAPKNNDKHKGIPIPTEKQTPRPEDIKNRAEIPKVDWSNIEQKGYKPIEDTTNPSPPTESGTGAE